MWKKKPDDEAFDRKTAQGSAFDKMYFTDDELKQGGDINRRAESGEITWGDAHNWWENTRNKYGYTGGENGHGYTKIGSKTEAPADYKSQYQNAMDMATLAVLNRKPFEYDPKTDPMYQQYADTYTRKGQRAMDDTIGKVSARTGGLSSSYATTVATQANDNYMAELAARVPELRQLAYDMYLGEDNRQRQNLNLVRDLEATDYGRYRDAVGDSQWQQNFDRNVFEADRNWNYQQERDAIVDEQYNDELNFNRALTAASLLAQSGNFSGYKDLFGLSDADVEALNNGYIDPKALQSAELMAQAGDFSGFQQIFGLSKEQVAKLEAAYKKQNAAKVATGSGVGAQDYSSLFAAAYDSRDPKSFIANNYKRYGFNSPTGLYDAYEDYKKDRYALVIKPTSAYDLQHESVVTGTKYGNGAGIGIGFGDYSSPAKNQFTYNGKSYSSVEEMVDAFAATNPSDAQIKEFEEKYLKPLGLSFE